MPFQPDDDSGNTTTTRSSQLDLLLLNSNVVNDAWNSLSPNQGIYTIVEYCSDHSTGRSPVGSNAGSNDENLDGLCSILSSQDVFFNSTQSSACETSDSSEEADEEMASLILDMESDHENEANTQSTTRPMALNSTVDTSGPVDIHAINMALYLHPRSTMKIHDQPGTKQRLSHRGRRPHYLKGTQRNRLSIKFTGLNGCLTKPNQSFYIQATLVTTRHNPHHKVLLHQHEMICNGPNTIQNGLNSFVDRITEDELRRGIKTFRNISITKTELNEYQFELTPFNLLFISDQIVNYTLPNEDDMDKIQKSKIFHRTYHMKDFRIIFQLLIEQDDQWYSTDLSCQTRVMTDN